MRIKKFESFLAKAGGSTIHEIGKTYNYLDENFNINYRVIGKDDYSMDVEIDYKSIVRFDNDPIWGDNEAGDKFCDRVFEEFPTVKEDIEIIIKDELNTELEVVIDWTYFKNEMD
jgi:hypothetical protein